MTISMKKTIGMMLLAAAMPTQAFELAKTDVVRIPANANETTKLAAEELTNYVARVTGCKLGLRVGFGEGKGVNSIVIGVLETLGDKVPAAAKRALAATDNDEAAWAGVADGTLWFVGKDEVAELYMVYHFIETKLGVSWLRAWEPEDPGEYLTTVKSVELGGYAEFREPKFRVRRLDRSSSWCAPIPVNSIACAVRNGFQVYPAYGGLIPDDPKSDLYRVHRPRCNHKKCFAGGHSIFTWAIPGKKYFASHPEYFAFVDGKRVRNAQYCLSNPEVTRLMTEWAVDFFEKSGGIGQLAFGSVDSASGSCECENCRRIDPSGHDISTRYNLVVDAVSKAVWKRFPKADISSWAYANYRVFPRGVTFDPRMKIEFCDHNRCYAHEIDDPACFRNKTMWRMENEWVSKAPYVWIYDYFSSSSSYYVCFEEVMAHDLKSYEKLGICGWKSEWSHSDGYFGDNKIRRGLAHDACRSNWQWLYMTGKLLWDPEQDWRKIVDDAEKKYYGIVYPEMKKYHDYRRRLWAETSGCMGYPNADERRPLILNRDGAKAKLFELLGAADNALDRAEYRLFSQSGPATWDMNLAYLRRRLAEDRRNLENYWVKANEEYREIQKKVLYAYPAKKPIVVDGNDDEWEGVWEFEGLCGFEGGVLEQIPEKLKTTMKIAYDKDGLYVFFRAREPEGDPIPPKKNDGAWLGEGVEVLVKAPTADNLVYHFIANPDGRVWAETDRTGVDARACGATAKSVWGDGEWTLELAIPAKNTAFPEPGAMWKVNMGRNRVERKNRSVGWYTMDGISYADSSKFRPLRMVK